MVEDAGIDPQIPAPKLPPAGRGEGERETLSDQDASFPTHEDCAAPGDSLGASEEGGLPTHEETGGSCRPARTRASAALGEGSALAGGGEMEREGRAEGMAEARTPARAPIAEREARGGGEVLSRMAAQPAWGWGWGWGWG